MLILLQFIAHFFYYLKTIRWSRVSRVYGKIVNNLVKRLVNPLLVENNVGLGREKGIQTIV